MKFLTVSGSARSASTNTALLDAMSEMAPPDTTISPLNLIKNLPIFSPDLEGAKTPDIVREYFDLVANADGLIIASPEYVHAIPGGLKNAIDWLVSGDVIIEKPVVLVHASHRGDDMLSSLRLVLRTVSTRFNEALFMRFPLMGKSPEEIREILQQVDNASKIQNLISDFSKYAKK